MGAAALAAVTLAFASPSGTLQQTSDASVLARVAASCQGATSVGGSLHAELEAMYCGVNIVRGAFRLALVRGFPSLSRSSVLKAAKIRRCGFSHTPCGAPFVQTFQQAGYFRGAQAVGENLAWGQADLGSALNTLKAWLASPPHRANLLSRRWRDVGIAFARGQIFGRPGVSLWVLQLGRRG